MVMAEYNTLNYGTILSKDFGEGVWGRKVSDMITTIEIVFV